MNPATANLQVKHIDEGPPTRPVYPRARFYLENGRVMFELVFAKSHGTLEDGDVFRGEATDAQREEYYAAWTAFEASQVPRRASK